jgi:uncharacterized membrane protein
MDIARDDFIWCVIGVVVSFVLPVLLLEVRKYWPANASIRAEFPSFWQLVRPYVLLGIASTVIALMVLAFLGDLVTDSRVAFLAGYASDSTLQKMKESPVLNLAGWAKVS